MLVSERCGATTKAIDAGGKLVLPGFNNAHVHFLVKGNADQKAESNSRFRLNAALLRQRAKPSLYC